MNFQLPTNWPRFAIFTIFSSIFAVSFIKEIYIVFRMGYLSEIVLWVLLTEIDFPGMVYVKDGVTALQKIQAGNSGPYLINPFLKAGKVGSHLKIYHLKIFFVKIILPSSSSAARSSVTRIFSANLPHQF